MAVGLYLGNNPYKKDKEGEDSAVPNFTAEGIVPLVWYLMFEESDVKKRYEIFPDTILPDDVEILDERVLEGYREEPVAFITTAGRALDRLRLFRQAFYKMPYLWSYFRIIEILERQLDGVLNPDDQIDVEEMWKVQASMRHPDKKMSHVKVKGEGKPTVMSDIVGAEDVADDLGNLVDQFETIELDGVSDPLLELEKLADTLDEGFEVKDAGDDPFAELEMLMEEEKEEDMIEELGVSEQELLSAFSDLEEIEQEIEEQQKEEEGVFLLPSERPIIVDFAAVVADVNNLGRGKKFAEVLDFFDRLLHHVQREETRTRIILEIMQDIFRESGSNWRPTGQLSEDFMREQVNRLVDIMLGIPSPFVLIDETFDLEFWTRQTLQRGDERLMYKLSMLPSEEIHLAMKNGKLEEIVPQIRQLLTATNLIIPPKIRPDILRKSPNETNLWGFRVLVKTDSGDFRAGSIINDDTDKPWEQFFKEGLVLPSVRQDWHVNLNLRLDDYLDIEPFVLEFKGAKDHEEAFVTFVRWLRRSMRMYRERFGTRGTIYMLAETMLKTDNHELVVKIFDILNQLTDFGFTEATEVLSDARILEKVTTLYSA